MIHTYPEYEIDIRAAFDTLAAENGLTYNEGSMPEYSNQYLELKFGIEYQTPEFYVHCIGHHTFTEPMFRKAAGLPDYIGIRAFTAREHAQAKLNDWANVLRPMLDRLAKGDISMLMGL
jgi:hypothetical protein